MNENKSLERIHDELCVIGHACVDDDLNNGVIVRTLAKLPAEVRDRALSEVVFVHTVADGTVYPSFIVDGRKAFILLNFKGMRSERSKADLVAHEVAHYVLDASGINEGGEAAERAADDLCEKWGLRRAYKDYRRFHLGGKNERPKK
jgi:hypothetical protein